MTAFRPPFTLNQLFVSSFLIGMLVLSFSVILFLQQQLETYLYNNLVENGRTLSLRIAEESRLPIIQSAVEYIEPQLKTIATYPNVTGLAILDFRGKTLFELGSNPIHSHAYSSTDTLATGFDLIERSDSISIITSVSERKNNLQDRTSHIFGDKVRQPAAQSIPHDSPNIIGFVALTITKTQLQADLNQINRYILIVMWTGILSFTVVILLILRKLTQPIQRLAQLMSDPETVAHFRQAEVYGVREVQLFAITFNTLMARIAESQTDLARQIKEAVWEVKQQNAALIVARERAEAASRAKSQFVAHISHEIRTPLHGFIGFTEILAKTPLNPTQRSYLHLLEYSANSLSGVINSVLDFSKLEAGKTVLQAESFDLRDAIETTVRLFTPNAQAKGLSLEIIADPTLPTGVLGDRHRFAQIIRNLVDNAIKFTEHGRVTVHTRGVQQADGTFLCQLRVQDTGIGIPHDHQHTIFAAFSQVDDSISRQQGGTGLGLAICRQLVELMKGDITITSEENRGSLFQVTIPFPITTAPAKSVSDPPSNRMIPPPPTLEILNDISTKYHTVYHELIHVLVVDDNAVNRLLSKTILSHFQAEVIMTDSGHAALDMCRWQRFDLILMDIRMPGLDGLETTRRIRQWQENPNCQVPIIGLTADRLRVDHPSWREAGMNDCLFKPLSTECMAEVFATWGMRPLHPTPNLF